MYIVLQIAHMKAQTNTRTHMISLKQWIVTPSHQTDMSSDLQERKREFEGRSETEE